MLLIARRCDAAVLEPNVQSVIIIDAPAVLGLARFTEPEERYAFGAIVAALQAATRSGHLHTDDPEALARLLLGALTRGGMLIANSAEPRKTRDEVAKAMRAVLAGMATPPAARRQRT